MPPPSSKTVRLARGRHASPADGVCVMELRRGGTPLGNGARVAAALIRPGLVAAALGRSASHADASAGDERGLRLVDELIAMSRATSPVARPRRSGLREVVGIG